VCAAAALLLQGRCELTEPEVLLPASLSQLAAAHQLAALQAGLSAAEAQLAVQRLAGHADMLVSAEAVWQVGDELCKALDEHPILCVRYQSELQQCSRAACKQDSANTAHCPLPAPAPVLQTEQLQQAATREQLLQLAAAGLLGQAPGSVPASNDAAGASSAAAALAAGRSLPLARYPSLDAAAEGGQHMPLASFQQPEFMPFGSGACPGC
jgi:hypothetical protein